MSSESVGSCGDRDGGEGERNHRNALEEKGNSPRASRESGKGSPGPSDRGIDGRGIAEVKCPCGRGTCAVLVSRTLQNPGRFFYRCPAKSVSEQCKFFLWCDMAGPNQHHAKNNSPVKPDKRHGIDSPARQGCNIRSPVKQPTQQSPVKPIQLNGPSKPPTPICTCGAGRCSILTMQNGVDAGRKYYACAIKKGQGACNHFQWLDEAPGKQPEAGNSNLDELKLSSSNPVFKESNQPDNYNVSENKAPQINCNGEACEIDCLTLMHLPLVEPPVPRSPPVSPKRPHQVNNEISTSPMKRLSLRDGTPSVPVIGKCFRCGQEGHWMAECAAPSLSPCFKCGKPGHWKKDCPEIRQV